MINMKIKVENNLDEIVETLESKGYFDINMHEPNPTYVYTWNSGFDWGYCALNKDCKHLSVFNTLTTLAELKEM